MRVNRPARSVLALGLLVTLAALLARARIASAGQVPTIAELLKEAGIEARDVGIQPDELALLVGRGLD